MGAMKTITEGEAKFGNCLSPIQFHYKDAKVLQKQK